MNGSHQKLVGPISHPAKSPSFTQSVVTAVAQINVVIIRARARRDSWDKSSIISDVTSMEVLACARSFRKCGCMRETARGDEQKLLRLHKRTADVIGMRRQIVEQSRRGERSREHANS